MSIGLDGIEGVSDVSSRLRTSQKSPLDSVVDRIIFKMEELGMNDEFPVSSNFRFVNEAKLGNKKFVIRQPESIKQWRQDLKALLRQYLDLKFPKQEEVPKHKAYTQGKGEDEKCLSSGIQSSDDLSDLDQDIGSFEIRFKIKVKGTSLWYRLPTRFPSTLILQENGLEKEVCLSEKEQLIFQESFLARIFQGSHLEYIRHRGQPEKMSDSFWSGWKTQMGAASWLISYFPQTAQRIIYSIGNALFPASPAWVEYQRIVHPRIQGTALGILNNVEEPHPSVVEICGGEGELAVGIAGEYRKPMTYYLLEYNDLSLQRAKNLLLASKNQEAVARIIPIKTDVTNRDDYFVDTAKKEPMQKESVDLIIGSGALTESVLENKEGALAVTRKCHELLKSKGKMIFAGHASSFLDSEDFEALGFDVINRSFIGPRLPFSTEVNCRILIFGGWNKQFYVLGKK